MKKRFVTVCFLLSALLLTQIAFGQVALRWRTIAPGLQVAIKHPKPVWQGQFFKPAIYIFRFDLKHYRLNLLFAHDYQRKCAKVAYLAQHSRALIAVNGGFFSPDSEPLGLRVQNGKLRHKLRDISWWGVFYIRRQHAYIRSQRAFHYRRGIQFAIQSGPRLIINGHIPPLKGKDADRSAIGITRRGKIVLVVTHNDPISTTQLAKFMRAPLAKGGLNCVNALNLDGGTSSQVYANVGKFSLDVANFGCITDAIAVLSKSN